MASPLGGAPPAPALDLAGVTKRFGAVTALDAASLRVRAGTLHALLGENGAGKTTLMRVAFGMLPPDAGELRVDGAPRRFHSPADALRAGVGMVHQHFTIVPAMTVAENVALGRRGRYDRKEAVARVRRVADQTGLALDPHARAGALGVAAQQRLEIVKALSRDVRTLILDEPTAVLTPAEARELLAWLRRFVDAGHAVVLITHKLRDALAFADDVTVLRRGRTAGSLPLPSAGATQETLAELMLGEPPASDEVESAGGETGEYPVPRTPASARGAPPVIRARDLAVADPHGVLRVRGATFDVHAGEIVGIAGVEGAGQHELLRALAGRLPAAGGTLERPAAVGFVPEDRHRDALLLDASLTENVALRALGARRGTMRWGALARRTAAVMERFDVRAAGPDARAGALSGGNQQKLVVGRELAPEGGDRGPAALVAENPTRGLDIRATAAVHQRLREARDAGAAVVVYSSDLDEVLLLADRVLAMYAGHVTPAPLDREALGRAMLGASVDANPGASSMY